jgi:hypothetical protein
MHLDVHVATSFLPKGLSFPANNILWPYQKYTVTLSTIYCDPINNILWPYQQYTVTLSTIYCDPINKILWPYQQYAVTLSTMHCDPINNIPWPYQQYTVTLTTICCDPINDTSSTVGRDRNHPQIVPTQSPSDSKQKADGCLNGPPARWRSSRPWILILGHTVSELSSLISQKENRLLWESRISKGSYWLTADRYLEEKGKGSDDIVSWDALQKRLRKNWKYSFARSHPHRCFFILNPHCCLFILNPHRCLFILNPHCCLFTLYPHCRLFIL